MMQLDMLSWSPPVADREPARPSIDERWTSFRASNAHVFAEALRIARSWLDRGDRYVSTKAILEVLRVSIETTGDEGYRVNNDFSAPMSRDLQAAEPRLIGVLRMRQRRS